MTPPRLWDAAKLPLNKPPDEFKPTDCCCDYGEQQKTVLGGWEPKVYPTGSGHRKDCSAHERWETNGRTWNPKKEDNPYEFTEEARAIVHLLDNEADPISSIPSEFLSSVREKLTRYGDRTFISKHEINFLRQLKERYC